MSKIKKVFAREILSFAGIPTVETTVTLDDGVLGRSSFPSGLFHDTYEAKPLLDEDNTRMSGKGVLKAVDVINNIIAPKIAGNEAFEQAKIDKIMLELDGTQNKIKLGVNSILSVSQAVAKACAQSSFLPLSLHLRQFMSSSNREHKMPTPMFSVLEGGGQIENGLDFKEFLIIPATSHTLFDSINIGLVIFEELKIFLKNNNQNTLSAQKGGFAPIYRTNAEAFRDLKTVIEKTKYAFLRDVFLGVDVNANFFLSNKKYALKDKNGPLDADDLIEIYQDIFENFSLVYFEDPFGEDDWEGWKKMYQAFASKALIAGDSLTSTNPYRLQTALSENTLNAIVIKPSQIGTVTESLAVAEIAKFKGLKIIVSDRENETQDAFVADFAVAIDSDYVKFGAPDRERVIKYNRLLSIQNELENSELR
jgi:enolase